jgi:hypothetical protein
MGRHPTQHYSEDCNLSRIPPHLPTILPFKIIPRSALERDVLRNVLPLQLPPRLVPFSCYGLTFADSPLPSPYYPASWRHVKDHRATRLGQSLPSALRRTPNFFPHFATRFTFKLTQTPSLKPSLAPSLQSANSSDPRPLAL